MTLRGAKILDTEHRTMTALARASNRVPHFDRDPASTSNTVVPHQWERHVR